jgi:hypothetical protein
MENEKFSIAWWNTGLAPMAKSRADDTQRILACAMINWMILELQKDFIALGEVSDADIEFMRGNCAFSGYQLVNAVVDIGRSSFDTCFIYNESKIGIIDTSQITVTKGGRTLKVAQKIDLVFGETRSIFTIFVSHWPSRLWCEENHPDRSLLGMRLYQSANPVPDSSDAAPHIILLGDYNDEPFSSSLSEHLMASRDRHLVAKRKHLFYNPFWKSLAATTDEPYYCGSYFHKAGELTQWRTFDQIMFSHAFIAGKQWRLLESAEQILATPLFLQQVINAKNIFDHLPVTSEIEKVN